MVGYCLLGLVMGCVVVSDCIVVLEKIIALTRRRFIQRRMGFGYVKGVASAVMLLLPCVIEQKKWRLRKG